MRDSYKTKQKEAIISYISGLNHSHVTVSQVAEYFQKTEQPISATTVYRHLEKLVSEGTVKKYTLGNTAGTCYQYSGREDCDTHYHFKCNSCGEILHIRCSELDRVKQHVFSDHGFQTDIANTIFVGICERCLRKN